MRKQLYYEWKERGLTRVITLAVFVAVSAALLVMSVASMGVSKSIPIVGTALTGAGFVAMLVVATILAVDSGKRLFVKPYAYFAVLAPVPGWKMLGARLLVIAVDYCVVLLIGTVAVVAHGYVLSSHVIGDWPGITASWHWPTLTGVRVLATALANMIKYILLMFFARALSNSVFAGLPARKLFSMLSAFVVLWVWSLLDVVMLPFASAPVTSVFGMSIVHMMDTAISVSAYCVLLLIKLAALFVPTAYLIEKKMNL